METIEKSNQETPTLRTKKTKAYMRPRISRKEADYITEVLLTSLQILEQYEAYATQLDQECIRLNRLRRIDWVTAKKQGITEKNSELDIWQRYLAGLTHYHIELHWRLINKYKGLAEGIELGECKHNNTIVSRKLDIRNYFGPLKKVTEKQLIPLDKLGKKERLTPV
jgi:hypothetical protein